MERRGTRNGPSASQDGPNRDNDGMMRVLQGMMQSQQQQTELLRQGLLVAPREQRPGNVSDFRRLQPAIFSGTEKPLDAEQWLIDTTDLLKAARVPDENQVEVAKIQLRDVARTWWLAEEATLEKPITWDQFSKGFYERFFPATAQKEMEEQFIRLQQRNRSVDEYAAEFLRLSRFAPYMVSDEEKRASRFQQGLKMDVQMFLIPQQLKTYSQVLSIAREVERGLEKKNENQVQNKSVKRPFQLMSEEDTARTTHGPMIKRPFQPTPQQMICGYCRKPGHIQRNCRRANRLCLVCGSGNHSIGDCPFKRNYPIPPTFPARAAPPALPAPPLRRNPEPIDRRAPFPPQQYNHPQRGARPRADYGRGQVHNMAAEVSDEAAAEYETQYLEQEP